MPRKKTVKEVKPKIPHAYVHRSHMSGDKKLTRDAFLELDRGIVFFTNGQTDRGHKHYIYERAKDAHSKNMLEAFAILDDDYGLVLSCGTDDTSVAIHGAKHPEKRKTVYLGVPHTETEIHGIWEEDGDILLELNPRNIIDTFIHNHRKERSAHV